MSKPLTLVMTAAVMDLLHEGHLNLLQKMRDRGHLTLVILHDGFTTFRNKRKLPIENLEKRTRNLIDTGLVDIIRYTFTESPAGEFLDVVTDFRTKRGFDGEPAWNVLFMRGDDWADFPARATLERLQVPIEFVPYTKGISTSRLRLKL